MTAAARYAGATEERSDEAEIVAFAADAETERQLAEAFDRMKQAAAIKRGGIRAAIEHFQGAPSPKVIIVDVSESAMPLSDIDELANVCEPGVSVVVVGKDANIGLFRDLVRMGVTDYLVKPVPYDLLHRALGIAFGDDPTARRTQRSGKVVAVTGARGGVGATTLTVNVGWVLSNQMWRRVALVDLDLQNGAVGLMLDVKANHGLREALENAHRIDPLFLERTMTQHGQRLYVLTSEEALAEDITVPVDAVERLTSLLKKQFHYVFLDVPRVAGSAAVELLRTAEVRLIVADATVASVRDVVRRLQAIGGEEAGHRNIVALNHARGETRGEISLAQFEEGIGRPVDFVVPWGKAAVDEALNFGRPVASGKSPITDSIVAMAGDLVGEKPETVSLLKRLLKRR